MIMEKTEFKVIWEKTQKDWKENFSFILQVTLVLAIFSTVLSILNFYDLKSIGLDSFNIDSFNIFQEPSASSVYLVVIGYVFNFFTYLLGFIISIYLFKSITHHKIKFSESFNILLGNIFPLILTTLIYFIPLVILFLVGMYFLFKQLFLLALVTFILLLFLLFLSEYFIFFSYAILFRGKKFLDSYMYSYKLVKDNFYRTSLLPIYFAVKVFLIYILIVIVSSALNFFGIDYLSFLGMFIINFSIFWYIYLFMIFLTNYFLFLEKEKEIANELTTSSV